MTSKNRKHLDDEQLTTPEPEGDQKISRVLDIRGGNIVEIEYSDKRTTLCMIPAKYRKKLWIRKGSVLSRS
jgi:translation initiation factor IF-1